LSQMPTDRFLRERSYASTNREVARREFANLSSTSLPDLLTPMIPLKLTLRNFMSYGDEPTMLDFAGMHVVSLSGDNGNGKSALLDAMTYSLWGRTRASGSQSSTEDDLVRLGADDMEVAFEFRLGQDRYRATRKRSRR